MNVMASTFNAIAMNMTFRREQGLLKRMRGTPMPTGSYLGGIFGNVALQRHDPGRARGLRRRAAVRPADGPTTGTSWSIFTIVGIFSFTRARASRSRTSSRTSTPRPPTRTSSSCRRSCSAASSSTRRRPRPRCSTTSRACCRSATSSRACAARSSRTAGCRTTSATSTVLALWGARRACGSRSAASAGSSAGPDQPRRRRLAVDRAPRTARPATRARSSPNTLTSWCTSPWRCHARSTPSWRKPSFSSARVERVVLRVGVRADALEPADRERQVEDQRLGLGVGPACPSDRARATCRPSRGGRGATARSAPSRRRARGRRDRSGSRGARRARARPRGGRCTCAARRPRRRAPTRTSA